MHAAALYLTSPRFCVTALRVFPLFWLLRARCDHPDLLCLLHTYAKAYQRAVCIKGETKNMDSPFAKNISRAAPHSASKIAFFTYRGGAGTVGSLSGLRIT